MLGIHRVGNAVGGHDLARQGRGPRERDGMEVQPAARNDVRVADGDDLSSGRRVGEELLPDDLELAEVAGISEVDLDAQRRVERRTSNGERIGQLLEAAAGLGAHQRLANVWTGRI